MINIQLFSRRKKNFKYSNKWLELAKMFWNFVKFSKLRVFLLNFSLTKFHLNKLLAWTASELEIRFAIFDIWWAVLEILFCLLKSLKVSSWNDAKSDTIWIHEFKWVWSGKIEFHFQDIRSIFHFIRLKNKIIKIFKDVFHPKKNWSFYTNIFLPVFINFSYAKLLK